MAKGKSKVGSFKEGSKDDKTLDRVEKKYGIAEDSKGDKAIDKAMRGGKKKGGK
jgi:hypothetical protein